MEKKEAQKNEKCKMILVSKEKKPHTVIIRLSRKG